MDGSIPRCGALTVDGTPCARPPMKGQRRCHRHGGASPQARAVAQRRLAMAADYAIERLADVLEDPKASSADVIRAAVAVMDRAGYSPSLLLKHTTTSEEPPDWLFYATDADLAAFSELWEQMRIRAEQRMNEGDPVLPAVVSVKALPQGNAEEAEEAVLVEDEPDEE